MVDIPPKRPTDHPDAITEKMKKTTLKADKSAASTAHSCSSSGFGTLTNKPDEESCWAKAARKNRDRGHRTWQTSNILAPRQDTNARVAEPAVNPQRPKPTALTKKQLAVKQRWVKGYMEAEDKYAYIHGLDKVPEGQMDLLGRMLSYQTGMKGKVKAGRFVEWEQEGGWVDEGEWRENYDNENPFLNK